MARAVKRGQTDAVRVLLRHGAQGGSLVQLALDQGFSEIASLLEGPWSGPGVKAGTIMIVP